MLRKVMFPKGHVIHYSKDISGFQRIRLLCGKVTTLGAITETFEDYDNRRFCKGCLETKFRVKEITNG